MRSVLIAFAVLVATPLLVSSQSVDIAAIRAQIEALEARMRALQAEPQGGDVCPVVTRSLSRGSRGDDVRAVQDFLRAEGVFSESSTGYYGTLTEASVKRWQQERRLIDPNRDTAGWGTVGPRTRAAIVDRCAERARVATPAAPVDTPLVASSTATTTETCSSCAAPAPIPNRAPLIFGIDGTDEVEVGTSARYVIVADDPDNDRLTYEIDWGGGTTPLDALYALAGLESSGTQNTFTHTFPNAGLYILTATVRDPKGLSAKTTKHVRVSALSTTCESCATSTPIFTPETDTSEIQVPTGITSCATPWGGVVLQNGGTISAAEYFRGSVTYTGQPPLMRCTDGRWQKCDAAGQSCVAHRPPATNTTMQGLRRYADVVGAGGCGGLGSGVTVQAEPRTLLCANVIHQAPQGRCAYTQETTAVELFCSYNNWAERLTLR